MSSEVQLSEQEEELQSLRLQLQTLKERYHALQKSAVNDSDQMQQRKVRELVLENEKLKSSIDKLSLVIQERDKKILDLQSAGNDLGEIIEESQQNLQQTQEALQAQIREYEILQISWKSEREQLIEERDRLLLTQERMSEKSRQRLEELESLYNESEERLQQQATEKQLAQEDAAKAKMAQDDAEGRLKFAHYHLAKKVKETTELTDKLQAYEMKHREAEATIQHLTDQVASLRIQIDDQLRQESVFREQAKESIRSADAMVQGWEEKYLQLQRRWEEDEAKIKELSRVADRYHQMHSLWNNLNEFFCDVKGEKMHPEEPEVRQFQNLFEPGSPPRYMSNPFERE